ncbi:MAG: polysaccharide deacetylase family protein [Clostridia bacterium]|nr:polysaccharide deacetylase family protein [Clostridia bacterium]
MKKEVKAIILGSLLTLIISLSMITGSKMPNNIVTNSNNELSNKKIGWGIQRKNSHEQPDLGVKNKELIHKYNGMALGNKNKKYIYLTFDLGYEAGYTAKILDALKQNNVKGTFFITAHYVNTASDLVKRMIDEGHIVGNHTVNHKSMPSLSDDELTTEVMKLHQVIYEKYNYEMKYMRPPKGEFSERTLSLCEKLGYKTVMWSFAYVDWEENKQPSEEEAMQKIIPNLHNGEIMLLHATSKTNADIMDKMIKRVQEEGYEFRSLEEFVE